MLAGMLITDMNPVLHVELSYRRFAATQSNRYSWQFKTPNHNNRDTSNTEWLQKSYC